MQVKISNITYPAEINGKIYDTSWDNRSTKTITLEMDYATAVELFVDNAEWSIIFPVEDEQTHEVTTVEKDNSDYCLAGDITDHRDGTLSVKMGKMTDLEEVLEAMYGALDVGEVRE